jgi:outer membrane protein assembly factor BamB
MGMKMTNDGILITGAAFMFSIRHSSFCIRHSAAVSFLSLLSFSAAADWPQFLGPTRNGMADSAEAKLPDKFDAEPKPLWQRKLGSGFAGPAVMDGKVIVFHRIDDEIAIEALGADTGDSLWKFTAPTDYRDSFGMDEGPRATPTIADGRVFAHGADGMLFALDFKSGKLLWSFDSKAETNSPQGFFGRTCAPLVAGKNVILTPGGTHMGKPAGVIALNAATGKLVWQSVDDEASCSSPIRYGDAEKPRLLCWMRNDLWSLEATSGQVRHHKRFRSEMDASVNAATPIPVGEGKFFLSAGYGVGASTWALDPDDEPFEGGPLKQGLFESHYSTPVVSGHHLYGFNGRQEQGQTLRCIDLKKNQLKWDSPRVPGGTVIITHDKLICVTEQGELWIVRASPDKFEQLHVSQILRAGHRSYPALSDGVLFARDGEKIVAIKLR